MKILQHHRFGRRMNAQQWQIADIIEHNGGTSPEYESKLSPHSMTNVIGTLIRIDADE